MGFIGNIIWFIFAGVWLAIGHLLSALLCFVTIIGIQHLKLASLALAPIGKTIVDKEVAEAAGYSGSQMRQSRRLARLASLCGRRISADNNAAEAVVQNAPPVSNHESPSPLGSPAPGVASDTARSEVVLNFAEVTDCERIKDHQVLFMNVVDLVPGVTWNEQHSSRLDAMNNILYGDRSAS